MKFDDETIAWLGEQAKEEGDAALDFSCTMALGGDAKARAVCDAKLTERVARAHQAHRRAGAGQ